MGARLANRSRGGGSREGGKLTFRVRDGSFLRERIYRARSVLKLLPALVTSSSSNRKNAAHSRGREESILGRWSEKLIDKSARARGLTLRVVRTSWGWRPRWKGGWSDGWLGDFEMGSFQSIFWVLKSGSGLWKYTRRDWGLDLSCDLDQGYWAFYDFMKRAQWLINEADDKSEIINVFLKIVISFWFNDKTLKILFKTILTN